MPDASIINFKGIGELAKPMEKLIEKVSSGIGLLYEPTHIRRKAKANADAKEIEVQSKVTMDRLLARAEIENREVAQRALTRLVQEEAKAQENMEDVLEGTKKYLNEDAEPEKMDYDWLTHFFGKCRAVSRKEMQDLWSRILAGEANRTGSFSKRTVEFVSTMSSSEAQTFTRLCGHAWVIHGTLVPLVQVIDSDVCERNGINFSVLNTLDSLGLIHFGSVSGYRLTKLPETVLASYAAEVFTLTIPEKKKSQLRIGHALFSPMGIELTRITQAPRVNGMVEYALQHWVKEGYVPASPWPRR